MERLLKVERHMKTLKLKNKLQVSATLVSNDFIDKYMAQANGEFVKVYLFLLRHLEDPSSTLSISRIADRLNHTEKDIIRAFKYWESVGVLSLGKEESKRNIEAKPEKDPAASAAKPAADSPKAVPVEHSRQASRISEVSQDNETVKSSMPKEGRDKPVKAVPIDSPKAQKELKSLYFIAEQYLGKTLSHTDVETITYFYETLGMSADLIEYLVETCVENEHKNMNYIRKVAISWSDDGIKTVEEARLRSMNYNKNCYTVLNAFGIKSRGPAASEIAYIRKWTDDLGFSLDIIQEACSRTISATHQPSFEYADTILEKWHTSQVHHLKDIESLDAAFQKEKEAKKASSSKQKNTTKNLNNFERRAYDMDSLEAQLLNSN